MTTVNEQRQQQAHLLRSVDSKEMTEVLHGSPLYNLTKSLVDEGYLEGRLILAGYKNLIITQRGVERLADLTDQLKPAWRKWSTYRAAFSGINGVVAGLGSVILTVIAVLTYLKP
jgi:hypothetical protein